MADDPAKQSHVCIMAKEKDMLKDINPDKPAEKPSLQLSGEDGNVFVILAAAGKAARRAGWTKTQIAAFREEATADDYNHVIATCEDWFEVE